MVESRWFRRAGPGIAALGAVALIASTTLGAPARTWQPPGCPGQPRIGAGPVGAWYRLDPLLVDGARTGQRLVVGRAGGGRPQAIRLDAESFAAGPFRGTILVGSDDGRASRLSLVDMTAACAWLLGGTTDVVRHATVAPDGTTVFEFRVDRRSRADLGVWRRSLDGSTGPVRVLAPIEADERFGPTWLTRMSWSEDGRTLAVASCGEVACRYRLLDPVSGNVRAITDASLGDLVGFDADRLVAHGACRGLPCRIVSVALDGSVVTLAPSAGQAVIARDDAGRPVVVHEVDVDGHGLRRIGLDGGDPVPMDGDPGGRRLVAGPARSDSAAEHDPAWLLFGPDGRVPADGPVGPLLRHVPDGRAVSLDEVSR